MKLCEFESLALPVGSRPPAVKGRFNLCRSHGINGSHVDMLLCALAHRNGVPIFTTDGDFPDYARHLPIHLHEPIAEAAN